MLRFLSALALVTAVVAGFARVAHSTEDDLKTKPITTDTGEVGKLLKQWHKDGTAAGNVGDWYDNRDGEHSPLDLRPWPQLQKVKYSDDDIKTRRNWALMTRTRPHVTFGNSSTSGPPQRNGSNPRTAYTLREGLEILQSQYLGNNRFFAERGQFVEVRLVGRHVRSGSTSRVACHRPFGERSEQLLQYANSNALITVAASVLSTLDL